MSVGIVIPVWNLWNEMTFPCLKSLVSYTNLSEIHVYLVDNASTDETCTHAEKMGQSLFGKEHFTYIKNSENMGFAIACNQGAREAQKDGHEFILFLNNDTIVTKDWLLPLVKGLDNPRVGMVGPLLLYPDTTVQHCGVVFNPIGKVAHIYSYFPQYHPVIKKMRKYRAITGAVLLCRTKEFFELGCFCEGFKNGFEDIDLCYSYVNRGQMHQVIPQSIIIHHTSQTPGRLDANINVQNGQLLLDRQKNIVRDAHLYYASDGYVPSLTKDYIGYVRLQEEKRFEMNKSIKNNYSDKLCISLLNQEPFWHDGYQLLIKSLVKQNLIADALHVCQRSISFCYSEHNLKLFIDVAEKLDDEKLYLDIKEPTEIQLLQLKYNRANYINKFSTYFRGNEWYDKLLTTQELDTEEFGIY